MHSPMCAARSRYVPAMSFVHAYVALGDEPRARMWLERAYQDQEAPLVMIEADPTYDAIRERPWFRALVGRLGLTDIDKPK